MNLRSGQRKSVRMKDGKDDQEDFEAEDRVDGDEANADEDGFESAVPDRNLVPIKRATKGRGELKASSLRGFNEGLTSASTLPVEVPTDRQPSLISLQGCKEAAYILIIFICALILLQKPLYSACYKDCQSSVCSDALDKLYQDYPKLKTFFKNINVTYKICSKTDRPGVMLVLHNGNGNVANCIVSKTASLLSSLLGVHPDGEFLTVDGRTALNKYGQNEFLTRIMELRQKYGVVVFTYLEQIDSDLVQNLHFICDKDQNIRDKAIIILVLRVKTQTFKDINLEDTAKRQIKDLWGNRLDSNRVQPIIGRITNIVGSIDENDITECL